MNVAALHDGDLGSFRLPSTWVLGQRNTEMCLNFVWTPQKSRCGRCSADHHDVLGVLTSQKNVFNVILLQAHDSIYICNLH